MLDSLIAFLWIFVLFIFAVVSDPVAMVTHGIRSVEGIGYDWITKLIYFTDFYYKTLSVVGVYSTQPRVLLEDLGSPRSVVVHPFRG